MSKMRDEILSQKEKLINTFGFNKKSVLDIAKIIKNKGINLIEIVARGSSRNACEYFKYLVETLTNIRVSFIYPSVVTKYNGKLNKDSLYLAVSQGGKGEDVKIVLENAKKIGALTIAITNNEETPLNEIADYSLYMKVGKEESMAATKTFTAEQLLLGMLAYALADLDINKFEKINDAIARIDEKEVEKLAQEIANEKNLFVITRGKTLGIAKEVCCKLQETCFINANAFASSDFMHGPLALVDDSFKSLFLIPNDETKNDVLNLAKLVHKNKGKVYAILYENCDDFDCVLFIDDLSEFEYVFEMTFAIQLLASKVSEILGRNPDQSRNLNKYTITV